MALFSAILGNKAAKKAAKAQEQGANRARADIERGLELTEPFAETGLASQDQLRDALGLNGPDRQRAFYANFQTDPGFQEAVDFGQRGIIQNASALGLRNSGGTLKALQEHGQLALSGAFSDRLSRLAGLVDSGRGAASTVLSGTRALADTSIAAGNARAGGYINAFNATQAGIQNTIDLASSIGGRLIAAGGS